MRFQVETYRMQLLSRAFFVFLLLFLCHMALYIYYTSCVRYNDFDYILKNVLFKKLVTLYT